MFEYLMYIFEVQMCMFVYLKTPDTILPLVSSRKLDWTHTFDTHCISRLAFARNLDITILELQNSICFSAVLGNIMLFDSDSLCYFCDSIPCRKLDTLLAETASHIIASLAREIWRDGQ